MVRLLAEQSDTKSNVKLGGFQSQLQASYVSSYTEELWYNETVCLCIYIYIYMHTHTMNENFGASLNCFSNFIIKSIVAVDVQL